MAGDMLGNASKLPRSAMPCKLLPIFPDKIIYLFPQNGLEMFNFFYFSALLIK